MDPVDILKIGRAGGRGSGPTAPSGSLLQPPQVGPDELQEIQLFPPMDAQNLNLRQFTISSIDPSVPFLNPFVGTPTSSTIDPASSGFSARDWLCNLIGFIAKDPGRYTYQSGNVGVSFANLDVFGFGSPTDYQKTVGNVWLEVGRLLRFWMGTGKQKVQILKGFDGVLTRGEMLLVLGRPGSGCTTLLKTISGDTLGFFVDENSRINYQGIPAQQMHQQFRGETIYMAENDVHFNQLTVGQTLHFAAQARAPRDFTFPGITRKKYAECMVDVTMATFGLRHTVNSKVGLISGGERKRVSIAEATLSGSPLQCWDNSTRGLDSANALEFCRNLRLSADMAGATILVSLYQGSEHTYEVSERPINLVTATNVIRSLIRSRFCTRADRFTLDLARKPKSTSSIWASTVYRDKPLLIF
jgi:ATP-binding cassette subfamily G (WHITE) protein 2 (PDR)